MRRIFEVKYIQYTLLAAILLRVADRGCDSAIMGCAAFVPLLTRSCALMLPMGNRLANCPGVA